MVKISRVSEFISDQRTFSRDELVEAVGAETISRHVRSIDVHVRWLREKLGSQGALSDQLVTVRGIGYRFEPRHGLSTATDAR